MDGIDNEFAFVLAFNNKKVKELNPLLRNVIDDIYYGINDDDLIKAWRNHKKQKVDILLNINGIIKGISIKMGSKNSVHVESISEFCHFLYELGASEELVKKYIRFHYGDGTVNGKGIERLSTEQYKRLYQDEIDELNKFFNSNKLKLVKAINSFVTKGINSDYEIDGIIYGTPEDFLWISTTFIYSAILSHHDDKNNSLHFGSLICQPLNRCLNYNQKYSYGRFYVQVKWYSLFDDIIKIMNYNNVNLQDDNLGSILF